MNYLNYTYFDGNDNIDKILNTPNINEKQLVNILFNRSRDLIDLVYKTYNYCYMFILLDEIINAKFNKIKYKKFNFVNFQFYAIRNKCYDLINKQRDEYKVLIHYYLNEVN